MKPFRDESFLMLHDGATFYIDFLTDKTLSTSCTAYYSCVSYCWVSAKSSFRVISYISIIYPFMGYFIEVPIFFLSSIHRLGWTTFNSFFIHIFWANHIFSLMRSTIKLSASGEQNLIKMDDGFLGLIASKQ